MFGGRSFSSYTQLADWLVPKPVGEKNEHGVHHVFNTYFNRQEVLGGQYA